MIIVRRRTFEAGKANRTDIIVFFFFFYLLVVLLAVGAGGSLSVKELEIGQF